MSWRPKMFYNLGTWITIVHGGCQNGEYTEHSQNNQGDHGHLTEACWLRKVSVQPVFVDDVGVTQDGENAPAAAVKEQTNCEASVS